MQDKMKNKNIQVINLNNELTHFSMDPSLHPRSRWHIYQTLSH